MRGVKNLQIDLCPVSVLIGMNNSGKTSVLKAMQLALGDYSRSLCEEDFHIGDDQKRCSEILVDVRIVAADAKGKRQKTFNDGWTTEFGDKIQQETDGHQFVALRTRSGMNLTKGGYDTARCTLDKWPVFAQWSSAQVKEKKMPTRLDSIPFYAIDAQRDIHQELREKASFVGRVLGSVEYKDDEIKALEELIAGVNDQAVEKSSQLKGLKRHLDQLNQSFQGAGQAEITPFPKKIRDLSKHFSVHFGDTSSSTFSMEYHGMGTRSWASLLTVKAFIDLATEKHKDDEKPFFPIMAAEEPEAHLHPNAQRTLYKQLSEAKGQVIVSTHSPYLAAMAETSSLRSLKRTGENVTSMCLSELTNPEDQRRLEREIMHSRGEILFAKALVLCEGETEAQALPLLFEKYFSSAPFKLGVNFVSADGAGKYLPFFRLAKDLGIPLFLFSDGEPRILNALQKHYRSVFGPTTDINTSSNVTILNNTDFEDYLITSGFKKVIEDTIAKLDGPTAVADYIKKAHGTSAGRQKTNKPPCSSCNQPIFADVLRDYKAVGGYELALGDILDLGKPKYAPVIAEYLCKLDVTALPSKIVDFFKQIKTGVSL